MKIRETRLKGVFEIDLEAHEDHRGFFMRTYDASIFRKAGLQCEWVQENHSYSKKKGTLRGLHFQFSPHTEAKLVRAVTGEIYMAFVDLRQGSATFGQWENVTISQGNRKMLYVPRGLAMGMCTLTDDCTLLYKMDNSYAPESAGTIRWNDPEIGISWPAEWPILSEKDATAGSFREFTQKHGGLAV